MFGLGFGEILIIVVAVLIIFGPKKIPEIARGLADGLRTFRNATDDLKREVYSATEGVKKSILDDVEAKPNKPSEPEVDKREYKDFLKPESEEETDNIDEKTGPISRS